MLVNVGFKDGFVPVSFVAKPPVTGVFNNVLAESFTAKIPEYTVNVIVVSEHPKLLHNV